MADVDTPNNNAGKLSEKSPIHLAANILKLKDVGRKGIILWKRAFVKARLHATQYCIHINLSSLDHSAKAALLLRDPQVLASKDGRSPQQSRVSYIQVHWWQPQTTRF
jgi:hypothetical protein